MSARSLLFYFCLLLSIKSIQNTQCAWSANLAGHCGCCPLIGGKCVHLNTLNDLSMSWHLCVPEHRQKNFSLDECKPNLVLDKNLTRLCHTKNETFRLFPQCATKEVCSLSTKPRKSAHPCAAPMAVTGTCHETLKRFTFDADRGRCVSFNYTGCGGTANRFVRQNRCKKLCVKPS